MSCARPALAGLVASLVVGCRSHPEAAATIELWALGREGEVVERMMPEFERLHPGASVRVQQVPWSAAHEKLLTAYVGDSMPDVFQVGNTWVPEFVALGALEALDGRVAASDAIDADDYFPGILDTNVIDGRLRAIPWYVDTRLLFYRADLLAEVGFDSAPRSWDTWVEAMRRLRARSGGGYGILLPLNEWQPLVILALQLDAKLLREGERFGNFRSAEFRRAFSFYLDLFGRDLAPRAGDAQVANLYQDFARGYFSFTITGPWNLGEFARRLPAARRDDWSTAPMPAPGEDYPGVSIAGGSSLALFRASARKDLAWKMIEFLSAPERHMELYRLTGDLPARKSAWRPDSLAHDRRAAAFWSQLQHVRPTPKVPEWERIAARILQHAEAAIRGRATPEEALAALDRDADEVLAKRRWLMSEGERAAR
ncbi:MAG: sugar ABC transporter substrate-binding protein [Candidatus Binatia bacterium]